jgi:epoxyqueuosine reductase
MAPVEANSQLAGAITGFVKKFVVFSPLNSLGNSAGDRAWDEPLVGMAAGDDPIFEQYKNHIGPDYWTPAQLFGLAFPQESVGADKLSVIAWVLPQTKATKKAQAGRKFFPSQPWAQARASGEAFNAELRRRLPEFLGSLGVRAVAPMLMDQWAIQWEGEGAPRSNWSERHAAYAAGLGTFGLCDGLITEKGKAVRLGSVVARAKLPASPRPYSGIHDYCLYFAADGKCGKCITRCPVGALSQAGHDKQRCRQYVVKAATDYIKTAWNLDGDACGLCQARVPCQSLNPTRGLKRRATERPQHLAGER